MNEYAAWPGELEIRQLGGARSIAGIFKYSSLAVVADRGVTRKEMIMPNAFAFAINDPARRMDFLVGHSFDKPIASRAAGTFAIEDSADAVRFVATLPPEELTPTWITDAEKAIANGTMTGLSPGFTVPPMSAVQGAEDLIPEPGNPGVKIRRVFQAVVREWSVVTSGAYVDAQVDLREESDATAVLFLPRRLFLCL